LPHPGPLSAAFEAADVEILYLDSAPLKNFRHPGQFFAYPLRFVAAVVALASLIRTKRPALVHINTAVLPAAGLAAKVTGTPCVWHVREIELLQRSRLVGSFLRWCIRFCASRVIAISQAVATELGVRIRPKVTVVYHGVDLNRFHPGQSGLFAQLGFYRSARVIGYVGRLSPVKGLNYLVSALQIVLQRMPETYLVLAGPVLGYEKYVGDLKEQVNASGLADRVIFLDSRTDVSDLIRGLDLLVLPTTVPEGLGIVILEGLASGKPVIATSRGGPVEILTGCGAGRLVPAGDAQAIADAALELLSLRADERRKLGQEARRWAVERFSVQRMIKQLIGIYESLLETKANEKTQLAILGRSGN
jgi:glycosyltransferase involved in cell wall biosynthesis